METNISGSLFQNETSSTLQQTITNLLLANNPGPDEENDNLTDHIFELFKIKDECIKYEDGIKLIVEIYFDLVVEKHVISSRESKSRKPNIWWLAQNLYSGYFRLYEDNEQEIGISYADWWTAIFRLCLNKFRMESDLYPFFPSEWRKLTSLMEAVQDCDFLDGLSLIDDSELTEFLNDMKSAMAQAWHTEYDQI